MSNQILVSYIGETIEDKIEPLDFFNIRFTITSSMYIKFNLSISRNSNIGMCAKSMSILNWILI